MPSAMCASALDPAAAFKTGAPFPMSTDAFAGPKAMITPTSNAAVNSAFIVTSLRLMRMSGCPDRCIIATFYGCRHPGQVQSLRSEEHTSELQSRGHLVCRLLLEKKKKQQTRHIKESDDDHLLTPLQSYIFCTY